MQNKRVKYFYEGTDFPFSDRKALKRFIESVFRKEEATLKNLNIIFCTDKFLLEMNRQHLQHNYYTDIITFPLSVKGNPIEAELYISIERVRENAKLNKTSFRKELHRVIFHGCLHLTGYNDKSSQQIRMIREREEYYMRLYFQHLKRL